MPDNARSVLGILVQNHQHQNNELLHHLSLPKQSLFLERKGLSVSIKHATALGKGLRQRQRCPFYVIASHFEIENEANMASSTVRKKRV